jgi:hypothetical protein
MEMSCSNCNQNITAHFCGNCGQKKYKRIDKKYIWDEIQYTFLHTNKGFLYSVKKIIQNPGKTAKEFIDGNRVNHYKPILLLFVLSGISAFISFKVIGFGEISANALANEKVTKSFMTKYTSLVSSYSTFLILLSIPFYAFCTKIAFRKWGHNFYEHIVINTYLMCFYTLLSLFVLYPLMYIFKSNETLILQLSNFSIISLPIVFVWMCRNLYPEKTLKAILFRMIAVIVLLTVIFLLIIILLIIIGVLIAYANPEAFKHLIPKK